MAQQHGTGAKQVIDVLVAAGVPHAATATPRDNQLVEHVAHAPGRENGMGPFDQLLFGWRDAAR